MIKPWKDRVEEAAHFREEDYINDVQYFMQAEIDELRAENTRLRSALNNCEDALINSQNFMRATGAQGFGKVCIDANDLALEIARAALGEKS